MFSLVGFGGGGVNEVGVGQVKCMRQTRMLNVHEKHESDQG